MRIGKRTLLLGVTGLAILSVLGAAFAFAHVTGTRAASDGGFTRTISKGGTGSLSGSAGQGADVGFQDPEFSDAAQGESADAGGGDGGHTGVDRSFSGATTGKGRVVDSGKQAKSNPELNLSFNGLNFRQQRLANGGNQFSVEPPDQGLCAGNGFVVETVNDVFRVFHTDGTAATGVVDLNTFYGYIAQFNRTTGVQGPFVTDPSCIYDSATGHFFNLVLTLEVFPDTGNFTGVNHLDLAVSNTADPTGAWTIYRLPVQDDGTDGTPDHHCVTGPARQTPTNPNACFGDFPHIGADANGIYLTSNEYDFFGFGFHGAQVYAISKAALASLAPTVAVTQFDTAHSAPVNKPGFTLWPAQTGGGPFAGGQGGTEYFMSSTAADEATCDSEAQHCVGPRSSTNILVWGLSGTSSLNSSTPSLALSNASLSVNQYAVPPASNQKAGSVPLVDCINDTKTKITSLGNPPLTGCWQAFFAKKAEPAHNEVEAAFDSSDTRMMQVFFANGKLWSALDTDVIVNGVHKAGIEYFIVIPTISASGVSASLVLQGVLSLAGNNLSYPAIGVTGNGRGVT